MEGTFDSMTGRSVSKLPPLSSGACLHVGIDENGLGPVLGPLVVTGVAFEIEGPRPSSLGALVGDSKALVSHEDPSLGEAWARALLGAIGEPPRTPAEALSRLCIDGPEVLRAPCPTHPRPDAPDFDPVTMCWPQTEEAFIADDEMVQRCVETLHGWTGAKVAGRFLRKTPLRLVSVRSSIMCASRLNAAAREGRHRFLVDLHEMERLALQLHEDHGGGAPLDAICGKVGGMDFYGDNFGPMSSRMYAIEAEGGKLSAYRFPGFGRLAFMQDADGRDPLVGLASLVGKWVRELTMGRIVRYLRASALPEHLGPNEIPSASGYRDPNTKKLIAATELVRAHRGIPDRCFLR